MKKERTWSSMNLRQNGMIVALIVIILGFGIATGGTLFRPMNISNIFMQNSYEIILAIGMFFCLTTLSGELVFRGLTQVVLQGQTLSPFSDGFKFFASGFVLRDVKVFGVNAVCLVCLILGTAAIIFSEL